MEFEIGLELAESPTKIVNDLEKILLNKMTIIANKLCGVVLVYMIRNIYDMLLISDVGQDFALELKLYGLIGSPDIYSRYKSICNRWAQSSKVEVVEKKIINNEPFIRIRYSAIQSDYQDVLEMPEAYIVSESESRGTTSIIPWLQWLLLEGRRYVVKDFIFLSSDVAPTTSSRTGKGIMVPKKESGGWRVPEKFAGTIDDNFVTRTVDKLLDGIVNDLQKELYRFMK